MRLSCSRKGSAAVPALLPFKRCAKKRNVPAVKATPARAKATSWALLLLLLLRKVVKNGCTLVRISFKARVVSSKAFNAEGVAIVAFAIAIFDSV